MKTYFLVLISLFLYCEVGYCEGVFINTSIEEPSGIVYSQARDSLFVVDDEGLIFELTTAGEILNENNFGDLDLEGITLSMNPGELLVAREGSDNILFVDMETLTINKELSISRYWEGVKILKKDKSHGIEGITQFAGRIFVLNQSYNIDPSENPEDPSMIFEVKEDESGEELIIDSVIYSPFPDLAGICEKDGLLYILSDDEDRILVYDISENAIIQQFNAPEEGDHEGITFDNQGNMYIAIDGEGILKTQLTQEVN